MIQQNTPSIFIKIPQPYESSVILITQKVETTRIIVANFLFVFFKNNLLSWPFFIKKAGKGGMGKGGLHFRGWSESRGFLHPKRHSLTPKLTGQGLPLISQCFFASFGPKAGGRDTEKLGATSDQAIF